MVVMVIPSGMSTSSSWCKNDFPHDNQNKRKYFNDVLLEVTTVSHVQYNIYSQ